MSTKRDDAEDRGYDPQDDTLPTGRTSPTLSGEMGEAFERAIAAHRRTYAFTEGHEDAHRA